MTLPGLARFGVVGIAQNTLNVATFALAVDHGVGYRTAAVIAALLALLVSFALNRLWTFRASAEGGLGGHIVRYTTVFALSIALGIVILTVLVELAGLHPVSAQVAAIAAVALPSFVAQRLWVFR